MIGRVYELHEASENMEEVCLRPLPNATWDEADLQGEWAFSFGCDYEQNPYVGNPVWEAWAEGWKRGKENNEG